MTRTILIGDVHAKLDPLLRLIDKTKADVGIDRLVFVGDLVDRGEDPVGVSDFVRKTPNCFTVMGNHEDKHVRLQPDGDLKKPGRNQVATREAAGARYDDLVAWFRTLPLFLDLEESTPGVSGDACLVVHAGWLPGLETLEGDALKVVRNVPLRARGPGLRGDPRDWIHKWHARKPAVYGHHHGHDDLFGKVPYAVNATHFIDTGSGKGGPLTALILPGGESVSVPTT